MLNSTVPTPSKQYYLRGGDLYIQVKQILFRIHSEFFVRESEYWKNQLVGPILRKRNGEDMPLLQGAGPSKPLVLHDEENLKSVKPAHFAWFLWVIYNRNYGDFTKAKIRDWMIILRLSSRWGFFKIQHFALQHLEAVSINPIKCIKLYRECNLPEKYLFPSYVELASRKEMIGLGEARALGMKTVVLIQQARERLRGEISPNNPLKIPMRADTQLQDMTDIVASAFKISSEDARTDTKGMLAATCIMRRLEADSPED